MGLAASQARFLGITARKAECEYKSTELAQQKLELSDKMMQISSDYSNAMNATKLMWVNDAVEHDYRLTYSLLMMPTAMNGFDPYFVTSPSGAIVLNTEYAAAARAAGISKAGGQGSQLQRDKFIAALQTQGMVTTMTSHMITLNDFGNATIDVTSGVIDLGSVTSTDEADKVSWNMEAGMGAVPPMNKGNNAQYMTLYDMMMNENIGGRSVDWAKATDSNAYTEIQKKEDLEFLESVYNNKLLGNNPSESDVKKFNKIMQNAGIDDPNFTIATSSDAEKIKACKSQVEGTTPVDTLDGILSSQSVHSFEDIADNAKIYIYNNNSPIVQEKELEDMTLLDIMSGNIILQHDSVDNVAKDAKNLLTTFASIFGYEYHDRNEEATLDESELITGRGLNVDKASYDALKYAYNMTVKKFLSTSDTISDSITATINDSLSSDLDACSKYNRICTGNLYILAPPFSSLNCAAVNISNMMSAFLTYYDNMLTGSTGYVVGRSVDTSSFVTDNSAYQYVAQPSDDIVTDNHIRCADFFDMVYNNILEHGWREDVAVDDPEYLENALKNGRYSMSSLNREDGYYYQTRYNETGYMVEVADTDAINRAEAEFSAMKAEITYKEDSIDMKTKKLDTEISALSTEYDTVKNLITKGIEKTFNMFAG